MKLYGLLVAVGLSLCSYAQKPTPPDVQYGILFTEVQLQKVFEDSKIFPDCEAKQNPVDIARSYYKIAKHPELKIDMKQIVKDNFELPKENLINYKTGEKDLKIHCKNLWPLLRREADFDISKTKNPYSSKSSILPLPYAHIGSAGRTREIYYWDSYFVMLGLRATKQLTEIESMVDNFAYLINTYGHIPESNRSYTLSRSAAPFFPMMVEMLAELKGKEVYKKYFSALEKEYQYWMEDHEVMIDGELRKRVYKTKEGWLLNRFWDERSNPRAESYYEDVEMAKTSGMPEQECYTNYRAASSSGWNLSSRWYAPDAQPNKSRTAEILPVDLNCLMYKMESILALAASLQDNVQASRIYTLKAQNRVKAIETYFWNENVHFFTDFDSKSHSQTEHITIAGLYPYYLININKSSVMSSNSAAVIKVLEQQLLQEGGLMCTAKKTGLSWDAPYSYAPLQWVAVQALSFMNEKSLAKKVANSWLALNEKVFQKTGVMRDRYNVMNIEANFEMKEKEYQSGYGWTNGVYLAMKQLNFKK